jgi:PAS domain S-box-containing protein
LPKDPTTQKQVTPIQALKSLAAGAWKNELIDNLSCPITVFDRDYRILLLNRAAAEALDIEAERAIGQTVSSTYPPDAAKETLDRAAKLFETGESAQFDASVQLSVGMRWFRNTFEPLRDASGEVVAIQSVSYDITEQKQTEQALRNSESLLQLAQEMAHIGSFSRNFETGEVMWSDEQYRLYGYEPGELNPSVELVLEHVHPGDRQHFLDAYELLDSDNTDQSYEYRLVRKDGSEVRVRSTTRVEFDAKGKPIGIAGAVQDLTTQQQAQAERDDLESQLRQAQKMEAVGQLAGGVAHDFNNILTVILGNVQLSFAEVEEILPGAEELTSALEQIDIAAQRATTLTEQLLTFSRHQLTRPTVLDVNATLAAMGKMLRRLLTEDIGLTVSLYPALDPVKIDSGHLEQVIVNLVVNARDAMPRGGQLTLETENVTFAGSPAANSVSAGTTHVVLRVSDTGTGIDTATAERIFEPFFTTKRVGQGTGLGLSVVYGIVEQAGGHIMVESTVGEGSTFSVLLPRAEGEIETRPSEAEAGREIMAGSETILVCEDDRPVRDVVTRVLRNAGYSVLSAESASEALRLADATGDTIDLLITDVIMPDTNGRELAEKLSERIPRLKTLFMSGYTSGVISDRGVLASGAEFVQKPFSRANLERRVRMILDAHADDEPESD